jgi:hypothetical protein
VLLKRSSEIYWIYTSFWFLLLASCAAHSQGLSDDLNGTWDCEARGAYGGNHSKMTFRRESANTYLMPVEGSSCGFRVVKTGPGTYTVSPYGSDNHCEGTAELTFTANGKISGKTRWATNTEDFECMREGLIEAQEPPQQEKVILDHTCHGIKSLGGYSEEGYKCTTDEFAREQQATTQPRQSQQVPKPTSSQTRQLSQQSKQPTPKLDHICHGIKGLGGYDPKGHPCTTDQWAVEQPKK